MAEKLVPITRLGKFFGAEDYSLDIGMGEEWLIGDMKGLVKVMAPTNKNIGTSKIEQQEPGNMQFSIYQKTLDDMGVEIFMGDYIGYYESEDRVRYYAVSDDGYVKSDNKHTYGGYKPFYRTVIATYVSENEFRGI